ncbi:MAG TPA: trehalose-phosphatase, partial [Vicinamibacteria bacterium]
AATLEEMLAETELRAVRGHKSVEVRLTWANKGEAADRLLSDTTPQPGFVLAVGDDRTDEDVFERLPADAWTVHVGDGPSKARFNLPDPEGVHRLLTSLTV